MPMEGHRQLLRMQDTLSSYNRNREEAMLATAAVPAIRTHLAMLESIRMTVPTD